MSPAGGRGASSRSKRGATAENIFMMAGLMIVFTIILVTMTSTFNKEVTLKEQEFALYFINAVNNAIMRLETEVDDASIVLSATFTEPYTITVKDSIITVDFPRKQLSMNRSLTVGAVNLLDSYIDNAGTITIAKKRNNILVTDEVRCDIADDVCDPGCVIEGRCDPVCEINGEYCNPFCAPDAVCDFICETRSPSECDDCRSGALSECSAPCYSNLNKGYYDVDCVRSNDNICDPASHRAVDGVCDRDCLGRNGICDSDCTAQFVDADCPVEQNGVCESRDNCYGDCSCAGNESCAYFCDETTAPFYRNATSGCAGLIPWNSTCTRDCGCGTGFCKEQYVGGGAPNNGDKLCCDLLEYNINGACVRGRTIFEDNQCWPSDPFLENCDNSASACSCEGDTTCQFGVYV